jgi:hypothetical protein
MTSFGPRHPIRTTPVRPPQALLLSRHVGDRLSGAAVRERQPLAAPAGRRGTRRRPRLDRRRRAARPAGRDLGLHAGDGDDAPLRGGRLHRRADRLRGHGQRARRADGDGDVLRALHAALVSRRPAEGDARRHRRDADVLVHAAPPRRGELRPESRRHGGRAVPDGRDPLLPAVPRPLRASPSAGRRRCARREGRPPRSRGVAGHHRAGRRRRPRSTATSRGSPSGSCATTSRSASSARSTRTQASACGSWSTSRSGRCRRR